MSSYLLTPEQIAFRDKALVDNLRFKYKQLGNYPDEVLVKAYDDWFMTADSTGSDNEDDFLEFIEHHLKEK
jgi:hypothetical protein